MTLSWVIAPDRSWTLNAAVGCTILAAITAFVVSAMTLYRFGVMYDAPGGSFLLKLHPATYLFLLALLLDIAGRPDALPYIVDLPRRFPGVAFFVANWTLIVAYVALFQHTPVTPLIDSFFCAVAMLVLYEDFDEDERALMRRLLHLVMFVNACIGILEFATHFRLTPFVTGGRLITNDYRSTALLGHPLLNAGSTGLYALMLFFGGDRSLRPPLRFGLLVTQLVALVPFGGRTSLVLTIGLIALGSLRGIAEILRGRRFDMRVALIAMLVLPLIAVVLAAAWQGGVLDPLIDRFTDDKGSAEARVVIYQLFDSFSLEGILLGPNPDQLASLQATLGIEYGIENSWLGLVFQYGALMTVAFALGLFALIGELWRRSHAYGAVMVFFFLIQVSSSASLSVKSFEFNQFAILMLVAFDQRASAAKQRGGPAWSTRK